MGDCVYKNETGRTIEMSEPKQCKKCKSTVMGEQLYCRPCWFRLSEYERRETFREIRKAKRLSMKEKST